MVIFLQISIFLLNWTDVKLMLKFEFNWKLQADSYKISNYTRSW